MILTSNFSAKDVPKPKIVPQDGSTYDDAFTEEEFNKEFGGDYLTTNEDFEEDTTRANIIDFTLIEREEMTVDDLANTIGSTIGNMAIRVVGFSSGGYKIKKKMQKNQH